MLKNKNKVFEGRNLNVLLQLWPEVTEMLKDCNGQTQMLAALDVALNMYLSGNNATVLHRLLSSMLNNKVSGPVKSSEKPAYKP